MQKTKKQHYVPRCYLECFKIPGTYQIHVYDKKFRGSRVNSIYDIASENYFYDIKLSDVFTVDFIKVQLNYIGQEKRIGH